MLRRLRWRITAAVALLSAAVAAVVVVSTTDPNHARAVDTVQHAGVTPTGAARVTPP